MDNTNQNEQGLALGISIIALLVIFGVAPFWFGFTTGPIQKGPSAIFTGIYLQLWGVMFLLSYYFSHKTFFLRGLIWVCENFSSPRGRKMAFFYFVLAFGLGTGTLLQGLGVFSAVGNKTEPSPLPPGVEPIENWWYKDPALYLVIALSAGVIYYRYLKNKNNGNKTS
jgi:hypothetical protein